MARIVCVQVVPELGGVQTRMSPLLGTQVDQRSGLVIAPRYKRTAGASTGAVMTLRSHARGHSTVSTQVLKQHCQSMQDGSLCKSTKISISADRLLDAATRNVIWLLRNGLVVSIPSVAVGGSIYRLPSRAQTGVFGLSAHWVSTGSALLLHADQPLHLHSGATHPRQPLPSLPPEPGRLAAGIEIRFHDADSDGPRWPESRAR